MNIEDIVPFPRETESLLSDTASNSHDTIKFINNNGTLMCLSIDVLIWFTVFSATFNNISAISWWSVLLVEETVVPRENDLVEC
jgi:hypothetical protein